eukprot:TRINITY_DN7734_c0_g1_i1.p1 TRINITY_DN7734_c0_g1~~TRINITY_DN7734_c0_g1_i1.p1  ORF type:complete len:1489 (+),score=350.87 TRINITY_DN7734_c0_g1_i1:87-4469(+)
MCHARVGAAAALAALQPATARTTGSGGHDDQTTGSWLTLPDGGAPPAAREGAATVALDNGRLWVYAGESDRGYMHDVWSFDGRRWTMLFAHRGVEPRSGAAAWQSGGDSVLVFGGRRQGGFLGDMWRYNITAEQWTQEESHATCTPLRSRCRTPPGRTAAAAFAIPAVGGAERGYGIHGGRGAAGLLSDVWVWRTAGWTQLDAVATDNIYPAARSGHGALYRNGVLFVVGGGSAVPGALTELWSLNWATRKWTKVAVQGADQPGGVPQQRDGAAYAANPDAGELYLLGGVRANDSAHLSDLWALSVAGAAWRPLHKGGGPRIAEATLAFAAAPPTLWAFGGRATGGHTNALYRAALAGGGGDVPLQPVFGNTVFPPSRALHSAVTIDGDLIIFAGVAAARELGDLWAFTPYELNSSAEGGQQRLLAWRAVEPASALRPQPRHSHSASVVGTRMVLFGGRGRRGGLADLWELVWPEAEWRSLVPAAAAPRPAPRWGHAAAGQGTGIVVYGGWGRSGALSDCWQWHNGRATWLRLTVPEGGPSPGPLAHAAVVAYSGELWLSGGLDAAAAPTDGIWRLSSDLSTLRQQWAQVGRLPAPVSRHAMGVIGPAPPGGPADCPRLVLVGGETFDEVRLYGDQMVFLTPNASKPGTCGFHSRLVRSSQWFTARMGHSVTLVGGRLLLFGGYGATPGRDWHAHHTLSEIDMFELAPLCGTAAGAGDSHCFLCPPGYSRQGVTCTMCAQGRQSAQWGGECSPCPAGHYQPLRAAGPGTCVLCPKGTFSRTGDSYACESCYPYSECPQGAAHPVPKAILEGERVERRSQQPRFTDERVQQFQLEELETLKVITWIVAASVCCAVTAVYVVLVVVKKQGWCTRFCIFFPSLVGVRVRHKGMRGELQRVGTTPLGGCFSIIFVVLLIAFGFTATILPWLYDTAVTVRLVPRYLAEWEASSLANSDAVPLSAVVLTLHIYGNIVAAGACTQPGSAAHCSHTVGIQMEGLRLPPPTEGAHRAILSCRQRRKEEGLEADACVVVWNCSRCSLIPARELSSPPSVTVSFSEPGVYATHFGWTAETSSGVDDGGLLDSRAGGTLSPSSPSALFKGVAQASLVQLRLLPVLMRDDSEQTGSVAGTLVSFDGQTPGTQVDVSDLTVTAGLAFRFLLRQGSGLQRSVYRYQEPGFFIVYLLACAAGLLACMRVGFRVASFLTAAPDRGGEGGDPFAAVKQRLREARYDALAGRDSWLDSELQQLEEFREEARRAKELSGSAGMSSTEHLQAADAERRGVTWHATAQWRERLWQTRAEEQRKYLHRAERHQRLLPWGARGDLASDIPILERNGEVDMRFMNVPPERLLFDAFSGQPYERTRLAALDAHRLGQSENPPVDDELHPSQPGRSPAPSPAPSEGVDKSSGRRTPSPGGTAPAGGSADVGEQTLPTDTAAPAPGPLPLTAVRSLQLHGAGHGPPYG